MSTSLQEKHPATLRARFAAAFAVLQVAFGKEIDVTKTTAYREMAVQYAGKNGKHNGRTPGAFGSTAAKAHRSCYLAR